MPMIPPSSRPRGVSAAAAVFAAVACLYLAESDGRSSPAFRLPEQGRTYLDPAFGTPLSRISDALRTPNAATGAGRLQFVTLPAATASPFNLDGTRLLLQHDSYFGLHDGEGRFLRGLPLAMGPASEPRWSRRERHVIHFLGGNRLYRYDAATGATTTVKTFARYASVSGHGSDVCGDGDHLVLAGDGREVFVYDIGTGHEGHALDTAGRPFDRLLMTPDDNVVVGWTEAGSGPGQGVELFDRDLQPLRHLATASGPMAATRDADGEEVLVWANGADALGVCEPGLVKVRLADGVLTCLAALGPSAVAQVAAPERSGWAVAITSLAGEETPVEGVWPDQTNEVVQVRLDGTQTRRLAPHRSHLADGADALRVATDRDGTRTVFSSNFGLQRRLGRGYADVYLIPMGESPSAIGAGAESSQAPLAAALPPAEVDRGRRAPTPAEAVPCGLTDSTVRALPPLTP
jgi:hypothetical protein